MRELTRYDRVERIDLVEMNPQVVEACRVYPLGNVCRMDTAECIFILKMLSNLFVSVRGSMTYRPIRPRRRLVYSRILWQLL